ncbi:hypothetical protein ACM01_02900 [Streptomyces viridochromogenes]|uniref:Alpha/beta hydrolase n=1 Tax=Streptomyces viridochromogenes TaxID=1938 RepID=A0A0J8CFP1_STRVR|nr:hypothetical protein [Streptomyces viridochromogenes]KMS76805.1 hypothetical protein ACM01_02900 [Streptomyces viridochromogenes]KOG21937.1 hypothetical protein ADK36_13375 [Streptomyces viridochromogenes]KOG29875.1 hypothetical protein ADK35_01020 [Streptomyces viridochromogenes]
MAGDASAGSPGGASAGAPGTDSVGSCRNTSPASANGSSYPAGHFPHLEQPKTVADHMVGFLNS